MTNIEKQGHLITLEGGEGAGKTTAARFIREWFEARSRSVVMTREPGGSGLAERIRGILLEKFHGFFAR